MNVRKLIDMLSECDPDAEVYLMTQRGYPFEQTLYGVAIRGEFAGYDEGEERDENEKAPPHDRWTANANELPCTDVFLVEGQQVRYGTEDAWDAARRG